MMSNTTIRKTNDLTKEKPLIEFKLKGKKYEIHTLTLGQHIKVLPYLGKPDLDSLLTIVEILSTCSKEDLEELNKNQFDAITKWINEKVFNFIPDKEIKDIIVLNGVELKLIDLQTISIAEFAAIDILKHSPADVHKVLSIIYRPFKKKFMGKIKIEKYNNEDCEERAQYFLDLPMSQVLGIISFFLDSLTNLLNRLFDSLSQKTKNPEEQKMLMGMKLMYQKLLEDGTISSIYLPEITSLILKRLEELKQPKSLIS